VPRLLRPTTVNATASRPSTMRSQAHAPGPPASAASMSSVRTADVAAVRERSPLWGLTLVLGEIAERLGRRQAEELASDESTS
jgi:hypothetical protein